jgi:DNA-binding IclR family transcriptional regulator
LKQEDRYVIPSLDRAIQVLGVLAAEPRGMSLADLARRSDIPKSTLFRILVTLQKHHCVVLEPDGRTFRLGSYLWELGSRFADQTDLFRVSASYMADLADECGETVFLSKLEGGEVVYLRRMESPKSIAAVRKLQARAPVHCTATGRALIAWLPSHEVDAILDERGTESFNPATVTDREQLKGHLREVREQEYAVVDGEYNHELLCVSAPVLDHQRRPCAALTVAMLSTQVTDRSAVDTVGIAVRRAARSLSREMGGSPFELESEGALKLADV